MYNIQKAVSRLDFAPKLKEIQITDIKRGLGVFTPKADRAVSFAALQIALKKAGYTLDSAQITIAGVLEREGKEWRLVSELSGQRFTLEGPTLEQALAGATTGDKVEITGGWKTVETGTTAREVISPSSLKKAEGAPKAAAVSFSNAGEMSSVRFEHASFVAAPEPSFTDTLPSFLDTFPVVTRPLAPIRTTSPGLTVYKGGAVVPRLYFIRQHLGNLKVNRQVLDVSVSYTPSQRVQLEAQVPFSRTAFDDGTSSGAAAGLGNITLWGKYRFFRTVETYGDKQASVRFGLELPTGKKDGPGMRKLNAPEYVRQQLTPINGGLAPHFDLSYSQARGRVIFGASGEAVLRSERAGFRTGHELRVNTDLEYVLLPRDYPKPGGELFAILETNFIQKGMGRIGDVPVQGSRSTEYYLAPGLQYAAAPRFVIEGSYQFPLVRNTGPQALQTDRGLLLGVRYLF
ncbi:MAG: hypothetical protein QOC99_1185 [Acidobacteriota bacterium]|nr:hypothetical protein [Acidobacteriota bacterium]